jgi:hypothetical protein
MAGEEVAEESLNLVPEAASEEAPGPAAGEEVTEEPSNLVSSESKEDTGDGGEAK